MFDYLSKYNLTEEDKEANQRSLPSNSNATIADSSTTAMESLRNIPERRLNSP